MAAMQFCTFVIGEWLFGVDILHVQEIIRVQAATRIPLAPDVVHGLINLRGQIVTALDLRRRLGLPPRESGAKQPINVVVRLDDSAASLLVDEIRDMVEVDEAACEAPPETVHGPSRDLITGVCKLDKRLLLVLDVRKTLALDPALFRA